MKHLTKGLFLVLFTAAAVFGQSTWKFDKTHSNIKFEVTHLVISTVTGQFKSYEGEIKAAEDNWENAQISFTIDVASVDTENEDRDNHLKSNDFFNAEEYPHIKFESKKMEKVGENKYKLTGDFTMRDVTKEITLDAHMKGIVTGMRGKTRVGFKVTGTVDRKDYGVDWSKTLDSGGLVVSDEVDIIADVQLVKQ